MRAAHAECVKLVDAQIELRRRLGLPDKTVTDVPTDAALLAAARDLAGRDLAEAMRIVNKLDRRDTRARIGERLKVGLLERVPGLTDEQFRAVFDALEIETVRRNVLAHGRRVDGRGMDDLRPLEAHVGLLPRVHGSAFFGRGETQALASVTLGSASDSQAMDAVTGGPREKTFVLHYNFPPYSVGEVGRVGSPGRREIGHGALAERALAEVMPADYPYTVRVVSDIMSSNGSTSMASVCAGSLALMDAGVPVRAAVAGISMGLFTEGRRSQLVVDIIGEEDHCGDMDFKVAGTRRGVTAFQVDIKIRGLDWAVVEQAFAKARDARLRILDFMATVLAEPRKDLSPHAPRIHTVKIPPDRIGDLIGPGGKHIRRITDISGTQIDVEDDGTVKIFSASEEGMKIALHEIRMMTAEAEEGAIYSGVVTGIKPFGVFVEIFPGRDGLVHVSELADFHVRSAEEICKIGDQMWVKCLGVDEKGRIRLSRRAALAERDGAAQRGTPA
jgi:polyribonucleotide nucleotidyltransferase